MKSIPNHNLITLKRTLRHVLGGDEKDIDKVVSCYLKRSNLWISSEGITNAVSRLKSVYTLAVQFVLNHHNSGKVSEKLWVSKTRDGLPRAFKFLNRYLRSRDVRKQRLGLTVLRTYCLLETPSVCDVKSITDPFSGTGWDPLDPQSVSQWLMSDTGLEPYQPLADPDNPHGWFLSTSGGPNASPSFLGWVEDGIAVRSDSGLHDSIYKLASVQENIHIKSVLGERGTTEEYIHWLLKELELEREGGIKPPYKFHTGKLHFINEGGGKTRTIAIGDIFSQTALKPIHDYLMSSLRKLGCVDGTFDQQGAVRRLKEVCSKGGTTFYSLDLSSCTDRFPVLYQRDCLIPLLGKEVAQLWMEVISNRKFYNPNSKSYVKYEVGQPMGLLSSWASMAWSHHVVVQYCARKCGHRTKFYDYVILGDDLVIWDPKVAIMYRSYMTLCLGVGISASKSIVSKVGLEFAKTLIRKGVNVSPFPLKLIKAVSDHPNLLPMVWKDTYRWFGEIIPPLQLLQMVYNNKWWSAVLQLSCPLYSKGSSIWQVREPTLWAWLRKERVMGNEPPSVILETAMSRFHSLTYQRYMRMFMSPCQAYLYTIQWPMMLGVPEDFNMVSGDDFVMSDPLCESVPSLTVDVLFRRYDFKSKRVNKYIMTSGLIARASKKFEVVSSDYVVHTEFVSGSLRPNVG